MIRIQGKHKPVKQLSKDYFTRLNPKSKDGSYHSTNSIYGRIDKYLQEAELNEYHQFLLHIRNNLELIITGKPEEIISFSIEIYNSELNYNLLKDKVIGKTTFHSLLTSKIFNYKSLRESPVIYWLLHELDIKACVYCNMHPVVATNKPGFRKLICHFDHFFAKSIYPWLSYSFFNLIPSCHACNSMLKGSIEFTLENHLHPYLDNFDDYLKFQTKTKSINFFNYDSPEVNIELVEKDPVDINNQMLKKAWNTANVYKIVEQADMYLDEVKWLMKKAMLYDEEYINSLHQNFGSLFRNKQEIYEMITGNVVNHSAINQKPFAKISRDISIDLGLLPNSQST